MADCIVTKFCKTKRSNFPDIYFACAKKREEKKRGETKSERMCHLYFPLSSSPVLHLYIAYNIIYFAIVWLMSPFVLMHAGKWHISRRTTSVQKKRWLQNTPLHTYFMESSFFPKGSIRWQQKPMLAWSSGYVPVLRILTVLPVRIRNLDSARKHRHHIIPLI